MKNKTYFIEQYQFDILKNIEKRLYGDGSALTTDMRRDLANRLNVTLLEIKDQEIDEDKLKG
jgi:hypothetical protein